MKKLILTTALAVVSLFSFNALAQSAAHNCDKKSKECKEQVCDKKDCKDAACDKKDCKKENCDKKDCKDAACDKKDCKKDNCDKKDCKDASCNKKDCKKENCDKKDCKKGDCEKKECDKPACNKPQKKDEKRRPRSSAGTDQFAGLDITEAQRAQLDSLETALFNEAKARQVNRANNIKGSATDLMIEKQNEQKNARKEFMHKVREIVGPDQYIVYLENLVINGSKPMGPGVRHNHNMISKDVKAVPGSGEKTDAKPQPRK